MDIEEAERRVLEAVGTAFAEYLRQVKSTVFADPQRPDWLVWPTDLWPQLVASMVTPVIAAVYAEVLASEGVAAAEQVAAATATFVGQDLPVVTGATTIPDQAQAWITAAFAAGLAAGGVSAAASAVLGLVSASAELWQPMLGVMAVNGGAMAVNAAVFAAAQARSDGGRRRVMKTWIARDDERTRVTHAAVDNTTVGVNNTFLVGGFPLRYPHDPFGPINETVNCRCRLRFGVSDV